MAEQQEVDDLLLPFRASLRISSPEAEGGEPPDDAEPPETVAAGADGGVEVSGPAAAPFGSAAKETAVVPDGRDDAVVDSESSRTGVHMDEESVAGARSVGPRTEVPGTLDPKVVSESERGEVDVGEELCHDDANRLFSMLFGEGVSKEILLRWTNQGIRFSSDPDTCIGLVQHEGGPCGVLAALQAFVLKYLLFFPKELDEIVPTIPQADFGERSVCESLRFKEADFSAFTNNRKTRALLLSMVEILFLCGSKKRAAIAILCVPTHQSEDRYRDRHGSEMISNALESFSIESASDLQKYLRISIYTSQLSAFHRLEAELPVFGSQIGALLFLISALLSRGLESIQADRDDPSLPLVTAPFGHASQLLISQRMHDATICYGRIQVITMILACKSPLKLDPLCY